MKTAIIGAGRKRNGIGPYIGKYFQKNGANVTAVLGTNEETAWEASSGLSQYGINAIAYTDFNCMVNKELPDAVVIASPSLTHYEYLMKCIDARLHIFCEKPFFWQEADDITTKMLLENIFKKSENNNLKIAMNSQWPFSLPYYEKLCGPIHRSKAKTFFINLSPTVSGKKMIVESVPHALSILYSVFGNGKIDHLVIEAQEENIIIKFNHISSTSNCEVLIQLVKEIAQPRSFSYGFNNKIIHRVLDLENYNIYFHYSDRTLIINDPLELSVQDFISAVRDRREPIIGKPHIVNNMSLLKNIYDGCEII